MSGSASVTKPPQTGLVDMGNVAFYGTPLVVAPPFNISDLQNPDGSAIYGNSFSEIVLNVTWAELQPIEGGPIDRSAIDSAISLVNTYNSDNNADLGIKLRVWGGFTAPIWAQSIDSPPLPVTGPSTIDPNLTTTATIGRYWTSDYIAAWTSFQAELAALYDSSPVIRGISNTAGASATDEPFIRLQPTEAAQLVAGGFTDAAQRLVLRSAIADYTGWSTTPLDYTVNEYSTVDTGVITTDQNFSLAVLQLAAFSSRVVQAGNHALNNPLPSGDAFVYAQMAAYAALVPGSTPGSYQTASPINLGGFGNWSSAVAQGVTAHAGNIELWDFPGDNGFTGLSPAAVQSLATILAAGATDSAALTVSLRPISIAASETVNALIIDALVAPAGGSTIAVGPGGVAIADQTGTSGALILGGVNTSLTIAGDLDIGGDATEAGGSGALLAALAPAAYSTTTLTIGGTLQVWDRGIARVSGDLDAAAIVVQSGGTISADGTLSSTSGSAIVNDGVIEAVADQILGLQRLTLNNAVAGGGQLVIDPAATLILTGSVGAQQTVSFAANSITQFANDPYTPSSLVVEAPLGNLNFFGTIEDFTFADSLVLQGISASTVSYTGDTLTIANQSTSYTLTLSGQLSDLVPTASVTGNGSAATTTVTFVANGLGILPSATAPAALQAETGVAVIVPDIALLTPLSAVPTNNTTILVTITAGTGSLNAGNDSGNTTITTLDSAHTLILAGTLGSVERSLQSLAYESTVPGADNITLTVSDYYGMSATTTIAVNTGATSAAFTWATPSDGIFGDAANWTTSGSVTAPPGGGNFAIFNSDTSSGRSPYTVSGNAAVGRIIVADSLTLTGHVLAQGEGDTALIVNGTTGAVLTLAGGAVLTAQQSAIVGASGHGVLTLLGGALQLTGTAAALTIGEQSGSDGTVLDYEQITALGTVIVGAAGAGSLRMLGAAATLVDGGADIGQSLHASGAAVVDGGFWSNTGTLIVGDAGAGSLLIGGAANGITGQVTAVDAVIASQINSSGAITLSGGDLLVADASAAASTLVVGAAGAGALVIDGGNATVGAPLISNGTVSYNGTLTLGESVGGSGFVAIGDGGQLLVEGSAVLGVGGSGEIDVGQSASDAGLLALTGSLTIGAAGQVVLGGADASLLAPTVSIVAGGTLSGAGMIAGTIAGDTGFALAAVDNAGIIAAAGGDLLLHGNVTDAGVIAIDSDATITLEGGVAAEQTLSFAPGAEAVLGDAIAFAGTISGFAVGNLLDLPGIAATGANWSAGILTITTAGAPITLTIAGDYAPGAFFVQPDRLDGTEVALACFAAGTRVLTSAGAVAVDALAAGDRLVTITRECRQIAWIGRRRVDCRRHPHPAAVWPIRIEAGAFAADCPARDLFLSPDHAIYVDGVLIPAKYLLNGTTLRQVRVPSVTYYHLELPTHDVVLAEGLPTETFLDTGNRDAFANATGLVRLHPEFATTRDSLAWEVDGYAPLHVTGPIVRAVRAHLAARARSVERRRRTQNRASGL